MSPEQKFGTIFTSRFSRGFSSALDRVHILKQHAHRTIRDMKIRSIQSPTQSHTIRTDPILKPSMTTTIQSVDMYVVNESWLGFIPSLVGYISNLMLLFFLLIYINTHPALIEFEKLTFELFADAPISIDFVLNLNIALFSFLTLILFVSLIHAFNYWRYQILGEWRFEKDKLEVVGNYPHFGSEYIEYGFLKTIVTYKRQTFPGLLPGLGTLWSLLLFWKYKLSEIEIRTELSYMNSKGEHEPIITIDYVPNGKRVTEEILQILKAVKFALCFG
jgi:hypothetical protein